MISQSKISADLARALADAGVVSDPIPPTPDPNEVTCSPDCYHSEVESRSFMIDV